MRELIKKMKEIDNKFSGKIECISILRIIGALGVALYHMGFLNGYVKSLQGGVSLFFTISGFLAMYTTQKEQKHFLVKRLIRIVPLYWIMTIVTFVAMNVLPSMALGETGATELIKSMLFIPYVRPAMKSADVVRPMVGPAWTLYYDIYFAVLFYLCLKINHRYRGVLASVVCVVLVILSQTKHFTSETPFLSVVAQKWWISFALGILAFYILRRLLRRGIPQNRSCRTTLICISLISVILLFMRPVDLIEHGIYSFIAFVSLLLALYKTRMPKSVNQFGDFSYSFYLIHYYVIVAVDKIINIHVFSMPAILGSVVVITISCTMAFVSYRLVECKFGNWLKHAMIRTNA